MADNKKAAKQNFFVRIWSVLRKWFRDLRSELKKVVWPTPKQTINKSVVVAFVVLIVGAFVSLFSLAATQGVSFLINLR